MRNLATLIIVCCASVAFAAPIRLTEQEARFQARVKGYFEDGKVAELLKHIHFGKEVTADKAKELIGKLEKIKFSEYLNVTVVPNSYYKSVTPKMKLDPNQGTIEIRDAIHEISVRLKYRIGQDNKVTLSYHDTPTLIRGAGIDATSH